MQRSGWRSVLVVQRKTRTVLAGNARLAVAKELGWKEAPVLFVDDDAQAAKAFAIADNRTAELAEWDLEELAKQLGALDADDVIGWNAAELDNLSRADWNAGDDDDEAEVDTHKRDPAKPKGDDSRSTLVLTGRQLSAVLAALEHARAGKGGLAFPKGATITVGVLIEAMARSFVAPGAAAVTVQRPRKARA